MTDEPRRSGRYVAPGGSRGRGGGRGADRRGSARGGAATHRGGSAADDWRRPAKAPERSASAPATTTSRPATASGPVVGTLAAMCSREEVREREQIKDVSRFELHDAAPIWAVKKYRRPAAGRVEIDAAQLRPPHVLDETLRHLFANVLPWPRCGFDWTPSAPSPETRAQDFLALYHFLNDRLRCVRQDFVVQRVRERSRIAALVRIARFYVLASFRATQVLDFSDKTLDWSEQLNDQQLASALTEVHAQFQSERAPYTDGDMPANRELHEEAVAYDLILHLRDPRAVSLLLLKVPSQLLHSEIVRRVLALFVAFHTGDWSAFFKAYRALPGLQQCLALRHLPVVWTSSLHRMNKAFGKIDKFALTEIAQWTDLPSAADARLLCSALDIHMEDEEPTTEASASTSVADSWEESAASRQESKPVSGGVKFKINSIRGELDQDTERKLIRSKANFIQSGLAGRFKASDLVMDQ